MMKKQNFNTIPEKERKVIIEQTSVNIGLPPYAVEKDWWVSELLRLVFEMDLGDSLVFKGGTSLSKAWKIIERFSEDIDLAIDRNFFSLGGKLSKSKRTKLRKEAKKYIMEDFYPKLETKLDEQGYSGVALKRSLSHESDQDPNVIEVYYPSIIGTPGYIEPKVKLEIGCRSLREPFERKPISSLVDEQFPENSFAKPPAEIATVIPERTFLEKLFLLHEEFMRPAEKRRHQRMSRHLYDIYQLSRTRFADRAIQDKKLYQTIVDHRHQFTRVSGVDYNLHNPRSINPIPPESDIGKWKDDYKAMQEEMIYGDSPEFEQLVKSIRDFLKKLKTQDWEFDPPSS